MEILDRVEIIHNNSGHPFHLHEIVTIFRVFKDNTYDVCNKSGDCWRVNITEIFKINNPMKQMTEAVINTAKDLCKTSKNVSILDIKQNVVKTHPQYFWTQAYISAVMSDAYKAGIFTQSNIKDIKNIVYSLNSNTKIKNMSTVTVAVKKTAKKVTKKSSTVVESPKVVSNDTKTTTKTISKTKALELMENNRGHFFTATFITKEGELRTMNCQYLKDQSNSKLGYVKVKEAIKAKVAKEAAKKAKAAKKKVAKPDVIRNINMQTLKTLKIAGNSYKVK